MKETPLSNCEKEFVLKAISEKQRLDGRESYDYRRVKIVFGLDRGCCQVLIGSTRVLAQVSSEITSPKPTRPADGILFTNVELSPMASPSFEPGRMSEFGVELNRLLERCLKESRCIDTESLCIVAGEKVWTIRVDIHVLNHDGNILDCVSIAAITALAHFRRPDITVSGEEVTIHPVEEKDPVPLSVLHMPICVTFAFFDQGKYLLVDPSEIEEKVMDGHMVIGMNKHREICTLQMTGDMLLLKDQVLRCSNIAVVKVTEITELIQKALASDASIRVSGEQVCFTETHDPEKITANQRAAEKVDTSSVAQQAHHVIMEGAKLTKMDSEEIVVAGINVDFETITLDSIISEEVKTSDIPTKAGSCIGEGGPNTWGVTDEEMEEELEEEFFSRGYNHRGRTAQGICREEDRVPDRWDDSEEEVVMLQNEDLYVKRSVQPSAVIQPVDQAKKPLGVKQKVTSPESMKKKKKKKKGKS